MDISVLEALLTAEQYEACANMAVKFLEQPDHDPQTKAQASLLLCRSRIGQKHYTAAIEPGHAAAFIAREHGLYDLLGKALCDTAYAFYYMGHFRESAHSYREFLQHQTLYSDEVRSLAARIRFNLATALRDSGDCAEARECFREAWQQLEADGDHHRANEARFGLVWTCLRLGQLDDVEALLQAGSAYLARFPDQVEVKARHLVDTGLYHFLRGEHEQARTKAAEATRMTDNPRILAEAQLVVAQAVLAQDKILPAFCTALEAKENAWAAQRKDLIAQADALIDDIILWHERVILDFVRANTGVQPKRQEG